MLTLNISELNYYICHATKKKKRYKHPKQDFCDQLGAHKSKILTRKPDLSSEMLFPKVSLRVLKLPL